MTSLFSVQNSTLNSDTVGAFVTKMYGLRGPIACDFWRKGMSDTYRVQTPGQTYFLKVSMAGRRTARDVLEEVRLLLHLLRGGIGVAAPIEAKDGAYVLPVAAPEGERYIVLYKAASGLPGTTDAQRRALGQMVARMHLCSDLMDPPYGRDDLELGHLIDDNLRAIETLMVKRKEDFDIILRIAAYAKETVENALLPQSPDHGVCHGDLHGGDVLYSDDGQPVIFDFESSGTGWRALDLAVFTGAPDWMETSTSANAQRKREQSDFLEGYSTVRQLSRGERTVLQLDGAVHHIFLMGTVLRFWTGRDGRHWADDDFMNWHMNWFRDWLQHHPI